MVMECARTRRGLLVLLHIGLVSYAFMILTLPRILALRLASRSSSFSSRRACSSGDRR